MNKVCVVIGSRANYSSIKSAMRAFKAHDGIKLQLVLSASAILDRYGSVNKLIEEDGFAPDAEIHMLIEGETPETMAKSTGLGLLELPTVLSRLEPDFVVVIGDRFETMSVTLAAAYMNIPIAHTMGGEVSGTIDESIRHATTKFAHVHFPASKGAAERIIKLGERSEDVHLVGCPRIDLVKELIEEGNGAKRAHEVISETGVGGQIDLDQPFLLVSQHPVTTEYGLSTEHISNTLKAVSDVGMQAIVLWPNPDAGSDEISRGIRRWREQGQDGNMRFFKNLPIDVYIHLMNTTSCLVGNSSSGIREGAFIGTPVVNVGTRQSNRERGQNVIDCSNDAAAIHDGILRQINHGKYAMDAVYGDGSAGVQIAEILSTKKVNVQKCITF